MIPVSESVLAAIRADAERAYPRECCGVVVITRGRQHYVACANITPGASHFAISPQDYAAAEENGEITHIVHSHPGMSPLPSEADLVGCERSGLPWMIVNWPTGAIHTFAPNGYQAPLVGRAFSHGILDCYSLIRDYYRRELALDLPDFEREEGWWLKGSHAVGGNLYLDNFEQAGFVTLANDTPMQKHDGLLMQIGAEVPNHAAVYIGDGLILQHCMHRLSSRDIYGGYWQRSTVKVVRHRSLIHEQCDAKQYA
ncbi:MAG: C40 family peptidase [Collimonas sp.]